jgi:hypothetical protein
VWDERFAETCRRHPDLVAVYESGRGRLGLLLRQTLVPLGAERVEWMGETRAVAREVIADLRAAGFTGGAVVLQWLPLEDVARIVARWIRRWDGDPARRSRLLGVVERRLIDQRFVAARTRHVRGLAESPTPAAVLPLAGEPAAPTPDTSTVNGGPTARAALEEAGLDALKAWYAAMAPGWLAIQPARRRRLVLQTHVWIADLALTDPVNGLRQAVAELRADGSLARALERLVPEGEAAAWEPWIHRVRDELARALHRPPAVRTQAWARWLFFIPYRAPWPSPAVGHPSSPASTWTARPRRAKMEA